MPANTDVRRSGASLPPLPSRRYRSDWLPSVPDSPAASLVLHHLADFHEDWYGTGTVTTASVAALEPYATILRSTAGGIATPPTTEILRPSMDADPAVRFYADLTVMRLLSLIGDGDTFAGVVEAVMENPWYDTVPGYAAAAHHRGMERRITGATDEAILLLQDADVCHQAMGSLLGSAMTRLELGRSLLDSGDVVMAREMFASALILFDVHGTRRQRMIVEGYLAVASDHTNGRQAAIETLGRIVDDADNGLADADRRHFLGWMTRFYRDSGALDNALACSDRVGRAGADSLSTVDEWGLVLLRADVLTRAERYDEAGRLLDNVQVRRPDPSFRAIEAEVAFRRAEIHERRGEGAMATGWYEEAARVGRDHQPTDIQVAALRAIIRRYRAEDRLAEAAKMAIALMDVQERLIDQRRRSSGRMLELRMAYDSRVHDLALEQERYRSRTVIETHEHVSNRIARGLQDRVGTILDDSIRMVGEIKEPGDATVIDFGAIADLLQRTRSEVRTIAHELSSDLLREQGLAAALAMLVRDVSVDGGPTLTFTGTDMPPSVAPDVALAIYRSIQTLLVNALVHAGATTIHLALDLGETDVVVSLTDDGRGFDPATVRKGMGLRDADVRMAIVGGTVDISSTPGQGTRIVLTAPLPPA